VCTKLVVRHPHIFGDVTAETADKVLDNWEEIKIKTKGQSNPKNRLEDVPKSLPALMRAYKVVKRAEKAGTDLGSLEENIADTEKLIAGIHGTSKAEMEEIMGNLLIKFVIMAKKCEIEPEEALTKATNRYIIEYEG